MLNKNDYANAYQENNDQINFLKFGLLNEYGEQIERFRESYNINDIIKKRCKQRFENRKSQ